MRSVTLAAIQSRYGVSLEGPFPIHLPAGRSDLPALCRDLGVRRGVEVGVWKGAYSEEFCRAIPGVQWTCVDPWAPYADYREKKNDATLIANAYAEAMERLAHYDCAFLRSSSVEAAEAFPAGSLDVVYIDGNHEAPFVRQDLETWSSKLRPGGILAGHDYRVPPESKPFIQVKAAVDQYVSDLAIAPWFIFAGDRTPSFLWVL
jgi:hypothetical protein